jgi:P-type Ca2+ transporter type 2C
MDILIVAVTVIVVAIPGMLLIRERESNSGRRQLIDSSSAEGLPLAVTLALAFATTRMVKEHNLVRILRACETMGNATVICSDKTGTLTQNRMTVVAGTLLADEDFNQLPIDEGQSAPIPSVSEIFQRFPAALQDLITRSIALNSIAFEEEKEGRKELIGSKTEVAMLQLARDYFGMNLMEERANATMVQLFPFDSSRKCMGVVYREPSIGYRFFVKGASELMLCAATRVATKVPGKAVTTEPLSDELRRRVSEKINSYAQKSLRTIGIIYKDFPSWPPSTDQKMEGDSTTTTFEDAFDDMIWIGVVGIQDPLRPEVPAALKKCKKAGVEVKMVTGV